MSSCCNAYIINDVRTGDEICSECGLSTPDLACTVPLSFSDSSSPPLKASGLIEEELITLCDSFHLPEQVTREALHLLRTGSSKKTRVKAAQSLHQAFIKLKSPRTLKEISSMFSIPYEQIGDYDHGVSNIKPSDISTRVFLALNITNFSAQRAINELADYYYINSFTCASPQTILGTAIYTLHGHKASLKDIALACHVSKPTLLKHFKKISNK